MCVALLLVSCAQLVFAAGGIDNCKQAMKDISQKNICLECDPGYFISPDKTLCPGCLKGCATCQDDKTCDTCKTGFFNNLTTKVCDTCSSGCDKCESGSKCLECASDHTLKEGTCSKPTEAATSSSVIYVVIGVVVAVLIAVGVYFLFIKKSDGGEAGLYSSTNKDSKNPDSVPADIIDPRL